MDRLDGPRFENGGEMLIAGLQMSYTAQTRGNIPAQWQQFAPHIGHLPKQQGPCAFGVCWSERPGGGIEYLAGVEVSDAAGLPADFCHVRLPAGHYAVFEHRKHVSSMGETIDAIWHQWLPNSGYQATQVPWFERYTEEYNPSTGIGGIEIWIPINA